MAKKRKVRAIQPKEKKLTKFQKILIGIGIAMIPLTIFLFLPLWCRNYFVKELKLPEEIFLSTPQEIDLVYEDNIDPSKEEIQAKKDNAAKISQFKKDKHDFTVEIENSHKRIKAIEKEIEEKKKKNYDGYVYTDDYDKEVEKLNLKIKDCQNKISERDKGLKELESKAEGFQITNEQKRKERENKILKYSTEPDNCYKVIINGYSFLIPNEFTPSRIDHDYVEFRQKPRGEGRYIAIKAERRTRTIAFNVNSLTRLFIPTEARNLIPLILNATWHPVRLWFKAEFYASQGITGKIFTSKWDMTHVGYIFPNHNKEGYMARIFNMKGDGTVEFEMSDSVFPVTLREWVNVAMKIATPLPKESEVIDNQQEDDIEREIIQRKELLDLANNEFTYTEAISRGLNEYFRRNKDPKWLMPVAKVMQHRGFYPDVLALINYHKNSLSKDSKFAKEWDDLIDDAVEESVAILIDPQQGIRELNVYCKNKTKLDINQVELHFNITSNIGLKQEFTTTLLDQTSIRAEEEKHLLVKVPEEISLANAAYINFRVTKLEFLK